MEKDEFSTSTLECDEPYLFTLTNPELVCSAGEWRETIDATKVAKIFPCNVFKPIDRRDDELYYDICSTRAACLTTRVNNYQDCGTLHHACYSRMVFFFA